MVTSSLSKLLAEMTDCTSTWNSYESGRISKLCVNFLQNKLGQSTFARIWKTATIFFEKAAAARMMLHTLNPISFKIFMKKKRLHHDNVLPEEKQFHLTSLEVDLHCEVRTLNHQFQPWVLSVILISYLCWKLWKWLRFLRSTS